MTEQMGSGKRGSGHFEDEVIQFDGFPSLQAPMSNSYEGNGNHASNSKGAMPSTLKITRTSTGKRSTTPRRIGRRGDPRMNNAVKARLANPNLTLLDALLVGGFIFPNLEIRGLSDRLIIDIDNVSLCQRKNQLMRRLRTVEKEKTNKKKFYDYSSISASDIEDARSLNKANTSPRKIEPTSKQHETHNFSSLEHSCDASSSAAVSLHRQMLGECAKLSRQAASIPAYLQVAPDLHRQMLDEHAKLSQQAASIPTYLQAAPEFKRHVFAPSSSEMVDPSQGNNIFGQNSSTSNDAMSSALKNMAQSNQNPTAFSGCINMPFPNMKCASTCIQPQTVPFTVQSNPFSSGFMPVPQSFGPKGPLANCNASETAPSTMPSNPLSSGFMSVPQSFGPIEPATDCSAEKIVPSAMSSNPFSSGVMPVSQSFGPIEPATNDCSLPSAEQGKMKEQSEPSELEKLLFLSLKRDDGRVDSNAV